MEIPSLRLAEKISGLAQVADADEEGAVGLLVDRAVVARGRAQDMGLDPEGAQVLVELSGRTIRTWPTPWTTTPTSWS